MDCGLRIRAYHHEILDTIKNYSVNSQSSPMKQ